MPGRLAPALTVLFLLACTKGEEIQVKDLLTFLDATVINYQSQKFTLPENLPLDQDLSPGTAPVFTARLTPIQIDLHSSDFNVNDVSNVTVTLRMGLTPQNFSGAASLKLIIGNQVDIYNDNSAVQASAKAILPDTLAVSIADSRLPYIFRQKEVFTGLEITLEPTRLQSRQILVSGHVETFEARVEIGRKSF